MKISPYRLLKHWTIALSAFLSLGAFSQTPQLWTLNTQGGADGIGTVIQTDTLASDTNLVHSFIKSREGRNPLSDLIEASDGYMYGTIQNGGLNNGGVIYRISGDSSFEILASFDPTTTGNFPLGGLVEVSPGVFYGTTSAGASESAGAIYKFTVAGGIQVMHAFVPDSEGTTAKGSLVFQNGFLYGTTSAGGTHNYGTLYKFSSDSGLVVLHEFDGTNGGYPQAGLLFASNGSFYGTTETGGANNNGLIFAYNDTTGFAVEHVLLSSNSEGSFPEGKLIQASNGMLYGICKQGGASGSGTIFEYDLNGTYTNLYDLVQPTDGGLATGSLTEGSDNILYGITQYGGSNSFGTLFQIGLAGGYTKLLDFNYTSTGINPVGQLLSDGNGSFYGACYGGGLSDAGTIFRWSAANGFEKIRDLSRPLGGSQPKSSLAYYNGYFYGTTNFGGEFNGGVLFKMAPNGGFQVLHSFNDSIDGRNPNGKLTITDSGIIYGTTQFGGSHGGGTVFKWTAANGFQVLHNFNLSSDGGYPYSGVYLNDAGVLYGMTNSGGQYSRGTLYKIASDGTFTNLKNLNSFTDGGRSYSTLVADSNGTLYGTCREGGSMNSGVIFKYSEAGGYSILRTLNPFSDGRYPQGGLTWGDDGYLYGFTTQGGASNKGTIFRIMPDGTNFTDLYDLDGSSSGNSPAGTPSLIGSTIFGSCTNGGANNVGTIFKLTAASNFTKLLDMQSSFGSNPSGALSIFYPVCNLDEQCDDSIPCTINTCYNGACVFLPINPTFTPGEQSGCLPGVVFTQQVILNFENNPGGTITINGQNFDLGGDPDTLLLTGLSANGLPLTLDYTINATGCTGAVPNFVTAPAPCSSTNITFRVDMSSETVSPQGVHLAGTFNNWNASQTPLTDMGNGIYQVTLPMGPGNYNYNFINGSSLIFAEIAPPACGQNGKRNLDIVADQPDDTLAYCFGECASNCNSTSGWSEADRSAYNVYPNPATDKVIVTCPKDFHGEIKLMDITGRVLQTLQASKPLLIFPINNYSKGVYWLEIQKNGTPGYWKIVKE